MTFLNYCIVYMDKKSTLKNYVKTLDTSVNEVTEDHKNTYFGLFMPQTRERSF